MLSNTISSTFRSISVLTAGAVVKRNATVAATSTIHYHHDQQLQQQQQGRLRQQQQQQLAVLMRNNDLQQQQRRWKNHSGKMTKFLRNLDEQAHSQERALAEERRKKKKERKAAKRMKKNKKSVNSNTNEPSSDTGTAATNTLEDIYGKLDNTEESKDFHDDFDNDDEGDDDDEEENEDDGTDVPTLPDLSKVKQNMMKVISRYEESLKSIRGTEPTPDIFENIPVHAYDDTNTPLKTIAQVVIVSPTEASIACFDPTLVKEVKKSIQLHLGLNPDAGVGGSQDAAQQDGGTIRVYLPKVSMETRQATVKQLNKRSESYRVRIRKVRRRYMNTCKLGKDGKLEGISKDDAFRVSKEIEKLTEEMIQKVNHMTEVKREAIMG